MKINYITFLSLSSLKTRKLRSILTIFGVAIGIALIVFLISLGSGIQRLIENRVSNVEELTLIDVMQGEASLLAMDDSAVDSISELNGVVAVSPSLKYSAQINYKKSSTDIALYGIKPDFTELEGVRISTGENIQSHDGEPVIVLSNSAASLIGFVNLEDTIGQEIELIVYQSNQLSNSPITKTVKIIGITKEDEEPIAYVPISYLKSISELNNEKYDMIRVKVENQGDMENIKQTLIMTGYQIDTVADTIGKIDRFFLIIELIVGGIGAIAIIVASLGSLNTLTVSLLERTKEIGLLKALGATGKDVYRLFIIESLVIGVAGGIIGFIFGIVFGEVSNYVLNIVAQRYGGEAIDIFHTPFLLIIIICVVVLLISILIGMYPAKRAAKINILDALKHE